MIVTVIGARPQFVKAAVVSKALREAGINEKVIHTGQHYDNRMSAVFWDELGLPQWDVNLEAGSGSHGAQTAKMIEKMEVYLQSLGTAPKALLLYGDTNSTLAGSVVASKLQLPIIHVEAGLRSFNRAMPEEINRIVTDHLSSVLFCSSDKGKEQLAKEGITTHVYDVGDVMFDAVKIFSEYSAGKVSLESILPFKGSDFNLLTLHRPVNTDNEENLLSILSAVGKIDAPVLWPLHPRLREKISKISIPANLHITDPLSYFEMLCALSHCRKVLTDSGGLQKEAYWLKKPCITLRTETEWVETMHHNWNILTGADTEKIAAAYTAEVEASSWHPLYGDGSASEQIASIIRSIYYS
ncbi:MAG: non-hydrolyzing UDP-N-acetylglucosamine 2-epimerase [Pseudobacter sp.]|uniref:non-hydrolyzing UDP-N-acetylglucosamine 2-epimerase n=1 Tax=Pseudobacter sp. TaxID=2045420 RepID=UPI003F7F39E7